MLPKVLYNLIIFLNTIIMVNKNKKEIKGWLKIIRYWFFLSAALSFLKLRNYTYQEFNFYYTLIFMLLYIYIFVLLGDKSKWGIYLARGLLSIELIVSSVIIGAILFTEHSILFNAISILLIIKIMITIAAVIYLFTSKRVKQTYF